MPVDSKDSSTAAPTPDDTAIVMYTSGSTGTPKVVNIQSDVVIPINIEKRYFGFTCELM